VGCFGTLSMASYLINKMAAYSIYPFLHIVGVPYNLILCLINLSNSEHKEPTMQWPDQQHYHQQQPCQHCDRTTSENEGFVAQDQTGGILSEARIHKHNI
jgi:hypothetical protein